MLNLQEYGLTNEEIKVFNEEIEAILQTIQKSLAVSLLIYYLRPDETYSIY